MKGDAYGNIYVNSDCEFEVSIVKDSGSAAKIYKLGVLKKDPDKPWAYRMDYSESVMYDRDGYNLKRCKKDYMGNRLSLTPEGMVTGSFGGTSDFRLAIRPLNSLSARPGDDLLLQLGIWSKDKNEADIYTDSATGKTFSKVATMKESDYIAVYDKKMLWRANLYIAEAKNDWNDLLPWNAPPTGQTQVRDINGVLKPVAEVSPWWDESWGNNEWNRAYDGMSDFVSCETLPPGDGKQVVADIPDTKWYYRMGDGLTKSINHAVSYDHQGWDDPFSFVHKMESQRKHLEYYYTSNGVRFQKPIYDWKQGDHSAWKTVNGQAMTDIQKIVEIKACLPDTNIYQNSTDLTTLFNFFTSFRDDRTNRYDSFIPPEGEYRNYVHSFDPKYSAVSPIFKEDVDGITTVTIDDKQEPVFWLFDSASHGGFATRATKKSFQENGSGTVYFPYVPGLSDSIMKNRSYPKAEIGRYTAGVDCNGLVQRAHGYSGENYGAINDTTHKRAPVYWTGGDIPVSAMKNFTDNPDWQTRVVGKNNSEKILDTRTIADDDWVLVYDQFKYLVPGDVIVYKDSNGLVTHIMVVSAVKSPSGPDSLFVAEDLVVLESVYHKNDGVFGVVNTRHLGKLKDRDWSVWRQK